MNFLSSQLKHDTIYEKSEKLPECHSPCFTDMVTYRLFSHEEFTRGDYILMIVLSLAGIISLATEAYKRSKEKKPLDQG